MSKTTQIFQDHFYHLDSNRVKQYEETHVVDDVKVLEQPKKGAKTVLVHSPYLMANVLVQRKDLKKHDSDFWQDKYRPQINHIDDNASWSDDEGGRMYETYGEELEYVRKQAQENPKKVWTLLEADGKQYVCAGYHFVNRLGYFITEVEFDNENEEYFVD